MLNSSVFVAVIGIITVSLSGCVASSSGTTTTTTAVCPDSSTFPESPSFLTGSGTVTGSGTLDGPGMEGEYNLSGSFKHWIADHKARTHLSLSVTFQEGTMDLIQDQIQVCANDAATYTVHTSDNAGTDQICWSDGHREEPCRLMGVWDGWFDWNHFNFENQPSCQRLEHCPGSWSSKLCEVWTFNLSGSQAQMLGSMSGLVAKPVNTLADGTTMTSLADATMTLYFLKGTNQVVSQKMPLDAFPDFVLTYDRLDTTTKVTADQFDVPTEWECRPDDAITATEVTTEAATDQFDVPREQVDDENSEIRV